MPSAQRGPQYQSKMEHALAEFCKSALKTPMTDRSLMWMLQVGQTASRKTLGCPNPTGVGNCILNSIYDSSGKKEALVVAPPHADYRIKLALDPGVSVATK